MPQPAADGLIHSNGISTTNGLVIRAEDLAFSSKMESFTKRDTSPTSDTLFVVVQSLLAKYLLTLPEISAWLVEHPQVNQTQSSIEVTIRRWIESKFLLEYTSGHQPNPCVILPPPLNPPKNNRIQSLAWIYSNTQLNNRFQPLQKTYNNLIKHLDLTGHNSYNQTIDPVEFGPQVVVNNRICSMFSSNDYMGLSKHPSVVKAGQETYKRYGNSSSGSRIMTGTTSIHRKLEVAIADLKDCDDAVIFSSGFLANLALMSIFSRDTTIFLIA